MKNKIILLTILVLATILRVWSLDQFPAGINADEAAIGYNAWSLLQTGKDEHGASWPLVFRSFDDYKPPVYFYLVMPFVKFFGLSTWSVRLPSALLGIASVYLFYLIIKYLFPQRSSNYELSTIAALIMATSPWHLQYSRGGWEVNAALFFILLGVYGFFKSFENKKYLYLFVIALAISLYTYHSARLISPILALTLIIIYWRDLEISKSNLKKIFNPIILGVVVCLPLIFQMLSKEGQSRFTGVSVFSDTGPLWQALEARREHSAGPYVRLVHNQYFSYALRFTKNYLSHYSPRFLFLNGDEIARSKVPEIGQSYLILLPFYFVGLLSILKLESKQKRFFLIWFLISPLAAALTFQSPHALRSQNMVVPLSLITALGVYEFFEFTKKHKLISVLSSCFLVLLSAFGVAQYLHQYYVHYPKELPYAWQYGFDQIADYVKKNYDNYDKFIITDRYDQPYVLMAFYLKYPPEKLQSQLVMTPRDKFGFSTVKNFDKYHFKTINYGEDKKSPNTLIIAADEAVDSKDVIDTIKDPAGKDMYKIISTNAK